MTDVDDDEEAVDEAEGDMGGVAFGAGEEPREEPREGPPGVSTNFRKFAGEELGKGEAGSRLEMTFMSDATH